MDPYLEQRGLWEEVHTALIIALQQYLAPLVRPRYQVRVEKRTYVNLAFVASPRENLVGMPDVLVVDSQSGKQLQEPAATYAASGPSFSVAELPMPQEVNERYLEIHEVATGEVITAVEILSPTNKRPGTGRQEYEAKRLTVLGSRTHLVEIDLIRNGDPLPMRLRQGTIGDYRIIISRSHQRPNADIIAFGLRHPIPDFPAPLQRGESEPVVPLNKLLHDLYDRAGYDLSIDYHQPLHPPLSFEGSAWVQSVLQLKTNPAS